MLCNTVEEGQEKCYMYWPTKEGEPMEYGRMKVTLQSELASGDYIIRKLLVVNQKVSYMKGTLTEVLICFEEWGILVQQWLVCAPLGIHLEPINKQLMLLVII